MGSGFYSIKEAALRLQKSERSVYEYIRNGFIKKTTVDGEVRLDREDVELMAVDAGVDAPSVNRKTIFQMQSQIKKLQDEMVAAKHALGLRDVPPMRPDPASCASFITAVSYYMTVNREKEWTKDFLEKWAHILEMVDEVVLESLSNVSNNPQAWVPFFQFCSAMADFCWENDLKRPSLEWQGMAGRLETVRNHLRRVIVLWVEMGRGTIPEGILDALKTHKEALAGRLAKG